MLKLTIPKLELERSKDDRYVTLRRNNYYRIFSLTYCSTFRNIQISFIIMLRI